MLMPLLASSQTYWSTPLQITSGTDDDLHPVFAETGAWPNLPEEWLAFSRNGRDIHVMKTEIAGLQWADTVYRITTDSADNDYPTLAAVNQFPEGLRLMLAWQSRSGGNLNIHYSTSSGSGWSQPRVVAHDSLDNQSPHLAVHDSGYGMVWERNGRILYAQYRDTVWRAPEFVTSPFDTGNSFPVLTYLDYEGQTPLVVWEHRMPSGEHAIMHSIRTTSGWSVPTNLTLNGDNRRPQYYLMTYPGLVALTWERRWAGNRQIFLRWGFYSNGTLALNPEEPFAETGYGNPSINGFHIITDEPRDGPYWYYSAAGWENNLLDSIVLSSYGGGLIEYATAAPGSLNRNPTVSTGIWTMGGFRIWCVWSGNATGRWKLYGSNTVILWGDVEENTDLPARFMLEQNYPNPFNPSTKIVYRVGSRGSVELTVFDLLGRKIATLVNEVQEPGEYRVQFDGSGLSSGVYFYRLTAGSFNKTKKLLLLR